MEKTQIIIRPTQFSPCSEQKKKKNTTHIRMYKSVINLTTKYEYEVFIQYYAFYYC